MLTAVLCPLLSQIYIHSQRIFRPVISMPPKRCTPRYFSLDQTALLKSRFVCHLISGVKRDLTPMSFTWTTVLSFCVTLPYLQHSVPSSEAFPFLYFMLRSKLKTLCHSTSEVSSNPALVFSLHTSLSELLDSHLVFVTTTKAGVRSSSSLLYPSGCSISSILR